MRLLIIALIPLLMSCAAKPPEIRTIRVEVPVEVPCITPRVPEPAFAGASLRKTDSLEVKVRALLAERRQRIGYEREIVAALKACQ